MGFVVVGELLGNETVSDTVGLLPGESVVVGTSAGPFGGSDAELETEGPAEGAPPSVVGETTGRSTEIESVRVG